VSDRLCRPGEAPASRAARGRAVVLLSGGLDSATTLAVARADGWECFALTVRYGQRHAIEIDRARALAAHLGAREHRVVELDLRAFGGSSLLGQGEIPKSGPGSIAGAAPDGPAAATGSVAAGAVAAGSLPVRYRRRTPPFHPPTFRPATPSSSRWRSPGPRSWRRAPSFSGSTPSTTAAIPTAGGSSCGPSSGRPTWGHAGGSRDRGSSWSRPCST